MAYHLRSNRSGPKIDPLETPHKSFPGFKKVNV